jgi:hypothetical protein
VEGILRWLVAAGGAVGKWARFEGMWRPTTNSTTSTPRSSSLSSINSLSLFSPAWLRDHCLLTHLLTSHRPRQIGEGLQQLKRNDQQLDQQLEQISKGLTRLKGIAVDQSNEIKLQGVMIDQISDNMDKATGHLNDVNLKLKETLQKAGGATNIIVKMILLILLLGVAAYLYKMFA